jgi:UDP-N-acetylglucosamine--N-acetylmuramyl-(pentapeptide) pyrophosphoryl-undecaprenol N-acetylglucosamine transferase
VKKYRFLISGGGTGGHIYPAISIANELSKSFNSSEILFVGSSDRMEMKKVPENGYNIKGLWISGIKRKLHLSNLLVPLKVLHSLIKSYFIIKKFKPDFVIGTGGFASGPILYIATKLKLPTLIQEQNSYAGLTNKILSKSVELICVAYENMNKFFPRNKIYYTGNPVRKEISEPKISRKVSDDFFNINRPSKVLLILGGSLGAKNINEFISKNLELFKKSNVEIIWQCGKLYYNTYKKHFSNKIKIFPFIKDMSKAYSSADYIISRAGASVISELCIVAKPVIFIPSPNLAEDHQTKNALNIVKNNAALMVEEKDLDKLFFNVFNKMINDESFSIELSKSIKSLAKPKATNEIVEQIKRRLKNGNKL